MDNEMNELLMEAMKSRGGRGKIFIIGGGVNEEVSEALMLLCMEVFRPVQVGDNLYACSKDRRLILFDWTEISISLAKNKKHEEAFG